MKNYLKSLFSGRVSRKNFAQGFVLLWLVAILVWFFNELTIQLFAIDNLVDLLHVVFAVSLSTRRLHDLGEPTWKVVLLLVPFVNIYFFVLLFIKKGQDKQNEYGSVPEDGKLLDVVFRPKR